MSLDSSSSRDIGSKSDPALDMKIQSLFSRETPTLQREQSTRSSCSSSSAYQDELRLRSLAAQHKGWAQTLPCDAPLRVHSTSEEADWHQRRPMQRAPTLLVASPPGAVLETVELNAAAANPLYLWKRSDVTGSVLSTVADTGRLSLGQQTRLLVRCKVYMWLVVTLCALLYVVTGIQFWATTWLIVQKRVNENYVRLVFSITAATCPTAGVFLGRNGWRSGGVEEWRGGGVNG